MVLPLEAVPVAAPNAHTLAPSPPRTGNALSDPRPSRENLPKANTQIKSQRHRSQGIGAALEGPGTVMCAILFAR